MEPPKGLRTEGLRLWRATLAEVARADEQAPEGWRLDSTDLALLEEACRARDTIARLQRRVDREGVLIAGSERQMVVHPALKEIRMNRVLITGTLKKVELAPPKPRTAHLDKRGRDQLRDARRKRWPHG